MTRTLQISPYDPPWAQDFAIERERIARALAGLALRIDHIGSTSVPGLAAKPIIDIQVSVAESQPVSAFSDPRVRSDDLNRATDTLKGWRRDDCPS